MSEAVTIALMTSIVGVVGVLIGVVTQSVLQRKSDLRKLETELFLKYKIESLQQLQRTFIECRTAFLELLGNTDSPGRASAAFDELALKYKEFDKAYATGIVYLPNKAHARDVAEALIQFRRSLGRVKSALSEGHAEKVPYTIDDQKLDHFGVTQTSLRAEWRISESLNPSFLRGIAIKGRNKHCGS
jgi:hypothetical protein